MKKSGKANKNALFVLILVVVLLFSGCTQTENKKTVTIGIARWVSNPEYDKNIEGFKAGLAENGYAEGENTEFITENPEANQSRQREIIRSFIDKKVDLIYSLTTPGTLIAKEMVQDKPIVFSIVTFPVETGVINSLESSGNNLVGTRNYISMERQYAQFEKIYPYTKTLAFIHRKGEPNSVIQYNQTKDLLNKKGIEIIDIAAVDLEDIKAQLNSVIDRTDSMFSACDTLVQSGGEEIVIEFSKKYKKPSFTCNKDGIKKGALMGDIADFYTIGKISGREAALILEGTNPSSILTESPAEDYLMINTKTAAEIGIAIPQYVLDDAEEVVK
jgi:putative ABC transport system substrate-binding protein